eukprot:CAMPEP_0170614872 /NCGR_PEP_ID=MMETSP0224-20130122/25035_1 /TAXON_ID=285029 /ORGANISM="Togula jolla, Strain CCCM 725" /LENGTH=547 /DNA_ID=CAMNT_0010940565 /DNA_START=64 /DNA_END=1707 /DNA_ORIENTATION=+
MVRRHRRGEQPTVAAPAEVREERTAVFAKTKMCKFHILGMCTKGDACHFAHERQTLQTLPDLFRTKLCKTLINTGRCEDSSCRYAHNKEELRLVSGFNDKALKEKQEAASAALKAQNTDGIEPPAWKQPYTQPQTQPQLAQAWPQHGNDAMQAAMLQQMMSSVPGMDLLQYDQQAQLLQMGAAHHKAEAMRLRAMAAVYFEAGQLMSHPPPYFSQGDDAAGCQGWWGQPVQGAVTGPATWPMNEAGVDGTRSRGGRRGGRKNVPLARPKVGDQPGPEPQAYIPSVRAHRSFPSPDEDSRKMVVKHTFITLQEEKKPMRQVQTASACLAALGGPDTPTDATPSARGQGERPPTPDSAGLHRLAGQGSMPKLMSRAIHDPVQIDFGSLRSVSSNSLAQQADSEEESSGRSPSSRCVQVQVTGLPGLPHKSQSLPRLNALAEDDVAGPSELEVHSLGDVPHMDSDGEAQETDGHAPPLEKRSQDAPYDVEHMSTAGGLEGKRRQNAALLADLPGVVTVKNTFLDFGSHEPSRPIRAVHTAGGRLDLLGQE